jgi:uncharacterized protein (TIGR03435 family)
VASVKVHPFPPGAFGFGAGGGGDFRISGNRVTLGQATLTFLVMTAYHVKDFQISAMPAWAGDRDQRYDITAKTEGEGTPTVEQVRPMLQTLLAERFQLKFHRETRVLPMYDLVIGKRGPKLQESTGPRPAQLPSHNGPVIRYVLLDRSMADLVAFVAIGLDRPVLDKTGLAGRYDFVLEYTRGNLDGAAPDVDRSIFAAVQDLGLKLAPAKEPTEVLVIDHAERPSAN